MTPSERVNERSFVSANTDEEASESESEQAKSEAKEEANAQLQCPECESKQLIQDDSMAELVCENCGIVVEEDQVDRGPEWRAFNHSERQSKSRVGSPTTVTMHDKGLTTTIDWRNEDAYGRSLSPEKRNQMRRLRKWQSRIRTKNAGEKNLQYALSEIDRMASALGLPQSVRETASVIYREALEQDLIRGRSIEGVASACVYIACRRDEIPRSAAEIAEVSRLDAPDGGKRKLLRTYKQISSKLNEQTNPVNPKKYVSRFCSELGLSNRVEAKAREIIEVTAREGALSGKSPVGFAGAAIYTAALLMDEKRTQAEVAKVADVTEVTIRNRYQEQVDKLGIGG